MRTNPGAMAPSQEAASVLGPVKDALAALGAGASLTRPALGQSGSVRAMAGLG